MVKTMKIAVLGSAGTYAGMAAHLMFIDGICPRCGGMLEGVGNKMFCMMCGQPIRKKESKMTKKTIAVALERYRKDMSESVKTKLGRG